MVENSGRDLQTVFITAIDRMNTHCVEQNEFDLTKTTTCCLQANVEHQDAVFLGSILGVLTDWT